MKINVIDKNRLLDQEAVHQLEARLFGGFARFGQDVLSVTASVAASDRFRDGIEHRCSVVLRLRKMPAVVVAVTSASLSSAINEALRRSERTLMRRVRRRRQRRYQVKPQWKWKPELGLE